MPWHVEHSTSPSVLACAFTYSTKTAPQTQHGRHFANVTRHAHRLPSIGAGASGRCASRARRHRSVSSSSSAAVAVLSRTRGILAMSDLLSRGVKTTGQAIAVALPHFVTGRVLGQSRGWARLLAGGYWRFVRSASHLARMTLIASVLLTLGAPGPRSAVNRVASSSSARTSSGSALKPMLIVSVSARTRGRPTSVSLADL